ncbi:hypothetical protein CTI14_30430, partial [Methylobacterium radiotolerans]
MLDPVSTLHRLGGIARGRDLWAFGISRSALSRAVRAGRIRRSAPGCSPPTTPTRPYSRQLPTVEPSVA